MHPTADRKTTCHRERVIWTSSSPADLTMQLNRFNVNHLCRFCIISFRWGRNVLKVKRNLQWWRLLRSNPWSIMNVNNSETVACDWIAVSMDRKSSNRTGDTGRMQYRDGGNIANDQHFLTDWARFFHCVNREQELFSIYLREFISTAHVDVHQNLLESQQPATMAKRVTLKNRWFGKIMRTRKALSNCKMELSLMFKPPRGTHTFRKSQVMVWRFLVFVSITRKILRTKPTSCHVVKTTALQFHQNGNIPIKISCNLRVGW